MLQCSNARLLQSLSVRMQHSPQLHVSLQNAEGWSCSNAKLVVKAVDERPDPAQRR